MPNIDQQISDLNGLLTQIKDPAVKARVVQAFQRTATAFATIVPTTDPPWVQEYAQMIGRFALAAANDLATALDDLSKKQPGLSSQVDAVRKGLVGAVVSAIR